MKNYNKLNQSFDKYKQLIKESEQIRRDSEINTTDGYTFSTHFHYGNPKISCWKAGNGVEHSASFEIHGDMLKILTVGMYDDEQVAEMQAIIENWLHSEVKSTEDVMAL